MECVLVLRRRLCVKFKHLLSENAKNTITKNLIHKLSSKRGCRTEQKWLSHLPVLQKRHTRPLANKSTNLFYFSSSPVGNDRSRASPGKAVVNLSDHFWVAESQTFHLRRGEDADFTGRHKTPLNSFLIMCLNSLLTSHYSKLLYYWLLPTYSTYNKQTDATVH